jgi:hypothetical protein
VKYLGMHICTIIIYLVLDRAVYYNARPALRCGVGRERTYLIFRLSQIDRLFLLFVTAIYNMISPNQALFFILHDVIDPTREIFQ